MGIIPTIDRRTVRPSSNDGPLPLRPTIHELHPTGLEQFMTCPYRYKYDNSSTSESARDAFYTGDIAEQLMTAYQYGDKLGDEVLRIFGNSTEFPDYQMLYQFAKLRKDAPKEFRERYPLFTQKRMTIRILMDKTDPFLPQSYHEIYLTGTADRVFSDYSIGDCKTAKSKWGKNEPDFKLQWRIYPRMRREISHLPQLTKTDTFNFTYFVWTKQKTPQLQIIPLEYKYEDSERLVYHLLSEYVKAYDNDEFNPKKCLACKWCALRDQCPLYGDDGMASFSSPNPTPENNNNSEKGEWRF